MAFIWGYWKHRERVLLYLEIRKSRITGQVEVSGNMCVCQCLLLLIDCVDIFQTNPVGASLDSAGGVNCSDSSELGPPQLSTIIGHNR
jgi:hypothetical protein